MLVVVAVVVVVVPLLLFPDLSSLTIFLFVFFSRDDDTLLATCTASVVNTVVLSRPTLVVNAKLHTCTSTPALVFTPILHRAPCKFLPS
jgi:hypothetical protein